MRTPMMHMTKAQNSPSTPAGESRRTWRAYRPRRLARGDGGPAAARVATLREYHVCDEHAEGHAGTRSLHRAVPFPPHRDSRVFVLSRKSWYWYWWYWYCDATVPMPQAGTPPTMPQPPRFRTSLTPPPPPPRHLQNAGSEPHRVTDEEDGHPELGRRGPEPRAGVVDPSDPPAHQRQESPTLTQPCSLEGPSRVSTIHQPPTAF